MCFSMLVVLAALVGETGMVYVDSEPSGAEVRLGELTCGKTPCLVRDLPGGEVVTFFLHLPDADPLELPIRVKPGEVLKVQPRISRWQGKLTVLSEPMEAMVFIDRQERGFTPLTATLEAGMHEVIVWKAGYQRGAQQVTVKPKESTAVELRLAPGQEQSPVFSKPSNIPEAPAPRVCRPIVTPAAAPATMPKPALTKENLAKVFGVAPRKWVLAKRYIELHYNFASPAQLAVISKGTVQRSPDTKPLIRLIEPTLKDCQLGLPRSLEVWRFPGRFSALAAGIDFATSDDGRGVGMIALTDDAGARFWMYNTCYIGSQTQLMWVDGGAERAAAPSSPRVTRKCRVTMTFQNNEIAWCSGAEVIKAPATVSSVRFGVWTKNSEAWLGNLDISGILDADWLEQTFAK